MKARNLIPAVLLLASIAALGQSIDSAIYVKNFPGINVGAKVTNAMATCGTNAAVPCILVIDPSLASAAPGTLPTLCGHCYLMDFRNGPPSSGGSGGSVVIPPSGDTTGVTDRTAINAQLAAGNPIQLTKGTYYIDDTGLTMATPDTITCAGPSLTTLQMEGTTGFVIHMTYDIPFPEPGGFVTQTAKISGCGFKLDPLLTQTAGGVFQIKPKDGAGFILTAPQIDNFLTNGLFWTGFDLEGPGIIDAVWMSKGIVNHPNPAGPGCFNYNAPGPGGDLNSDGVFCLGNGTQIGLTVGQGDTGSFTNLKMNGAYVDFTRTGPAARIRFNNPSIEDIPTKCPFAVEAAGDSLDGILITGGEFFGGSPARVCATNPPDADFLVFTAGIDATGDYNGGGNYIAGSANSVRTNAGSGITDKSNTALHVYAGDGAGNTVMTQIPLTAGSSGPGESFICQMCAENSGVWYAVGPTASIIEEVGGHINFYVDTGLTFNTPYTPTLVATLPGSGLGGTDYYWTIPAACTTGVGQPVQCTFTTTLPGAMADASYQLFCFANALSSPSDYHVTVATTPLPTASGGTLSMQVTQTMQNGGGGGTPDVYCHAHHN